ncbi:MAG: formate dehydrogenase accessory sulfurtransferase FdhD [Cyclobacteriaceae bacterium]
MDKRSKNFNCTVFSNGSFSHRNEQVVSEEPVEIRIETGFADERIQKSISVTMRTPGHDEELAIGFLFTEGIISSREQVSSVEFLVSGLLVDLNKNIVLVKLVPGYKPEINKTERNFYTTSSCGVCGKASIDSVRLNCSPVQSAFRISPETLLQLPEKLRSSQSLFDLTGGLHAAGLFDEAGNSILVREDVGRHNATDKVIGAGLKNKILPKGNYILMLSGRISFELIQKAAMAGIPAVAGVGAPSGLAIELAESLSMTVFGFVRDKRFNVYCGNHLKMI